MVGVGLALDVVVYDRCSRTSRAGSRCRSARSSSALVMALVRVLDVERAARPGARVLRRLLAARPGARARRLPAAAALVRRGRRRARPRRDRASPSVAPLRPRRRRRRRVRRRARRRSTSRPASTRGRSCSTARRRSSASRARSSGRDRHPRRRRPSATSRCGRRERDRRRDMRPDVVLDGVRVRGATLDGIHVRRSQ